MLKLFMRKTKQQNDETKVLRIMVSVDYNLENDIGFYTIEVNKKHESKEEKN